MKITNCQNDLNWVIFMQKVMTSVVLRKVMLHCVAFVAYVFHEKKKVFWKILLV